MTNSEGLVKLVGPKPCTNGCIERKYNMSATKTGLSIMIENYLWNFLNCNTADEEILYSLQEPAKKIRDGGEFSDFINGSQRF